MLNTKSFLTVKLQYSTFSLMCFCALIPAVLNGAVLTTARPPERLSQTASDRATDYTLSNKILTLGDKTHVCWLDSVSNIMIATYDHTQATWSDPVEIGRGDDNHASPALTVDSEGYLHVIFGPHGNPFQHKRSAQPNDISSWITLDNFGINATYASVVTDHNDTMHVVYRGGNSYPLKLLYQHRPKNGTWSDPQVLAEVPGGPSYTHYGANLVMGNDQTLHLGYHFYYSGVTWKTGYMKSTDNGNSWLQADGTAIALPVTPNSDVFFTEYDQGSNDFSGLAIDSQGHPWITLWRADVVVELWHYDGTGWETILPYTRMTEPIAVADLLPDHYPVAIDANDSIFIGLNAEQWSTVLYSTDKGQTFKRLNVLPPDPDGKPHRAFNFERPTGYNSVDVPWLAFCSGINTGGLNEVYAVQFAWEPDESSTTPVYLHHFDDFSDIRQSLGPGDDIQISSEQSVASGHSMKMIDGGAGTAPLAILTPPGLDDPTITVIVRYFSVGDDNDHASFRARAGEYERASVSRGVYGASGKLTYYDGNLGKWTASDIDYPAGEWVTYALVLDSTDGQWGTYDIYFAVGTEVTPDDLVVANVEMRHNAGIVDNFQMWPGWSSAVEPIYIDELEIYSELGGGIWILPSRRPGDANRDGKVDEDDAAILAANWLKTDIVTWRDGDFNNDGRVDDADATILAINWHFGVDPSVSVPEPGFCILLGFGCMVFFVRKMQLCRAIAAFKVHADSDTDLWEGVSQVERRPSPK